MPSSYEGAEPFSSTGMTGGSQQLTVLEAKINLTGNEWQKHPIVTGPEAPRILAIDYLRRGYFKDPKGYRWVFGVAALETEEIKQLSTLPGLSVDPFVVGLLKVKEQLVPIATTTVHRQQYRTNRDSLILIHTLICQLEIQGVISRTHSPFNSPIWPVQKSNGEWRLEVDYRGLNEIMPPLSAAVPDMLELQYELKSKAAKWYATTDIANVGFLIHLAVECRPHRDTTTSFMLCPTQERKMPPTHPDPLELTRPPSHTDTATCPPVASVITPHTGTIGKDLDTQHPNDITTFPDNSLGNPAAINRQIGAAGQVPDQ
ncbi:uncharacterized protein LOC121080348 [Falco naumanni]|uniref:uncharacterized protein LOC121080348 n=1 Tax=Falco naumanni TaxID=148594 RepID=UPI001ADE13C2|nr:uncharacterized protein LOC121080348 [Falco naumanni]